MPEIQFKGHVHPTRLKVSMTGHPQVEITDTDIDLTVKANIEFSDGSVTANCEVNKAINYDTVRDTFRYARMIATASVNLMAFSRALSLSVLFDVYVDDSGNELPMQIVNENLPDLVTAYDPDGRNLKPLVALFGSDPTATLALQDLVDSISRPETSAINCARSVETLRTIVAGNVPRNQTWATFREKLNLSEDFVKHVSKTSEGPRHGDYSRGTPNKDTEESQRRAWIIMNRYIEYKKNGAQSLSEDEFPLL